MPTILYTALINIYPHIIFQNGILHYTEFIEWKNITCCNIKKNLCWLGYGNKGLVINGDEFSFGTEEQFITFIKNKNHININLE